MNFFPKNISVPEATALQEQFAEQIILNDEILIQPGKIGGVIAYCRGDLLTVSAVILDKDNKILKSDIVEEKISFPEVPTFEGFRMGHAVVALIDALGAPDLLFVFGHGINHPRRCGFASHVGLALDLPTIAVSRDTLCGKVSDSGPRKLVWDDDDLVAEVVKATPKSTPLYISPGHKITLDTAVSFTKKMTTEILPKPLMVAQKELLSKMQNK